MFKFGKVLQYKTGWVQEFPSSFIRMTNEVDNSGWENKFVRFKNKFV